MIEIEPYRALWKREEQDNKELREIIEYKEQKIERQKEIIRQLDIKNLELTSIIKEVREYVSKIIIDEVYTKCILEILDKENNDEDN